jgi:pimeloyl-ACP methyl ester carboxylesterase
MRRRHFRSGSLTLSYLDTGAKADAIIALHAHWMEAQTFEPLARSLAPEWRLIALDQRGHGYSDHACSYTREDYLRDLAALYNHLAIQKAVLLGNSLGGVNAYQFAAGNRSRVQALVIEDIGVVIKDDVSFILNWKGTFESREQLEKVVGPRFLPYLRDSFRLDSGRWRLAFDTEEMLESQRCLIGEYWSDWLASSCPALLIRGAESRVTSEVHLREMAEKRPNTVFRQLPGGHVVHLDNHASFADAVREFLRR